MAADDSVGTAIEDWIRRTFLGIAIYSLSVVFRNFTVGDQHKMVPRSPGDCRSNHAILVLVRLFHICASIPWHVNEFRETRPIPSSLSKIFMNQLGRYATLLILLTFSSASGCGNKPADTTVGDNGTVSQSVVSTIGQPAGLPPVPAKIDSEVQQRVQLLGTKYLKLSQEARQRHDEFKQLGLAMHNFHDTFLHFPALNGTGNDDGSRGLSWRVHLLRYTDQAALYQQFHINEPWDSAHNKKLIAKMPKFYGVNAEGKTRIHVLTGNGAPFNNNVGLKLRDVTDGTSNTILCVEAGPDRAEIWTKPGGLELDPKSLLQCLGQIGDEFRVLMMDGTVRHFLKSMEPEQFAIWARHADHGALDFDALAAISPLKVKVPVAKKSPPQTPLAPATSRLDLSYIPANVNGAVVLHPRRFWEHPLVRKIRDQRPPSPFDRDSEGLPLAFLRLRFANAADHAAQMCELMGIEPQNVDEMVQLTQASPMPPKAGKEGGQRIQFGVILRYSAPIDVESAVGTVVNFYETSEVQEHQGVTLIASQAQPIPQPRYALAFINDSMFLVGHLDMVKQMISARESGAPSNSVTRRLNQIQNPLLSMAFEAAATDDNGRGLSRVLSPLGELMVPYLTGVQEFGLTIDLDAPELLEVEFKLAKPELVPGHLTLLNKFWHQIQADYGRDKERLTGDPITAPLIAYADQMVNQSPISNSGDTIVVKFQKPKESDTFPAACQPLIATFRPFVEAVRKSNQLREVWSSFRDYHSRDGQYPPLNATKERGIPSTGLSWRVELLKLSGHNPLYSQFKRDEPWDSPHNKKLISKMPKMFGTDPEGKTSLHIFTGPGAPFQADQGIKMSDIKDGLPSTLLVVETGDDLAEIWTKPGGLVFDPANPLKCLGARKNFVAVMMDGTVRRFQNIDPGEFSKLVQYQDGKPVKGKP
ncbi:MAG: hypothetical protein JWM11_3961 [Planctomycetaceae bacterium]|nr:hypothetical protein [Planctomycetaceae bacterium]